VQAAVLLVCVLGDADQAQKRCSRPELKSIRFAEQYRESQVVSFVQHKVNTSYNRGKIQANLRQRSVKQAHLNDSKGPVATRGFGRAVPRDTAYWRLQDEPKFPEGADIWNMSMSWVNVTLRHPAGVVSNWGNKKVVWADVSYLSLEMLYIVSLVAYPVALIVLVLVLAVLTGVCMALTIKPDEVHRGRVPIDSLQERDWPSASSVLAVGAAGLPSRARRLFAWWSLFCRTIPAWMVFGTPSLLIALTYSYPQEVFILLVTVSSVMVFSNGLYMVFFSPFMMATIQEAIAPEHRRPFLDKAQSEEEAGVVHWVILPNYEEDVETLSESLESVAQSMIAREKICVLLAMEEREKDAQSKAKLLKAKFADRFREVAITMHPPDLPNDPPGKASNVAWAFRWLNETVRDAGQDPFRVLLTIADADSNFHSRYFEGLTRQFIEMKPARRGLTLWQPPIFHVKNYHRQPMLLIVGTMFTAMSEIAVLSDPNSIRFPYSTYSLSLQLARYVGGWDAEWIAEDWHMGIKCFLLTMGASEVQPVPLPTVNYMPEDSTWNGTIRARWSQAKRHALGFSDLSYYFTMLPLLFCHASMSSSKAGCPGLQEYWRMFFHGIAYIVRLVNTHVVVGIMTLYMIISFLLKNVMYFALQDLRHVGQLFDRSTVACGAFFLASLISIAITTLSFQVVYAGLKDRIEPASSCWQRLFSSRIFHWAYTFVACVAFAAVYCSGLAAAVWIAAIKVLLSGTFEYEVAAKPTKDTHL